MRIYFSWFSLLTSSQKKIKSLFIPKQINLLVQWTITIKSYAWYLRQTKHWSTNFRCLINAVISDRTVSLTPFCPYSSVLYIYCAFTHGETWSRRDKGRDVGKSSASVVHDSVHPRRDRFLDLANVNETLVGSIVLNKISEKKNFKQNEELLYRSSLELGLMAKNRIKRERNIIMYKMINTWARKFFNVKIFERFRKAYTDEYPADLKNTENVADMAYKTPENTLQNSAAHLKKLVPSGLNVCLTFQLRHKKRRSLTVIDNRSQS